MPRSRIREPKSHSFRDYVPPSAKAPIVFPLIHLSHGLGAFVLATLLVLLGCDTNEAEPESDDAVELNLETLAAETEYGTLEAERIDDAYITAMGEGQAIGIALLGETGDPDQDSKRDVAVSLYEGGELATLIGAVDSEGEATLESADRSDFDATVELSVEGEAITGTATFLDDETAFTAEAAAGYEAERNTRRMIGA